MTLKNKILNLILMAVSFSTMTLYIKQIIKTCYVDVISILFVGETTRLTSEIVIQNLGNHALERYILIS
jgi:hypothetical protein